MKEIKSTGPMKAAKTAYIIISVLMILSGIALIVFPEISVSVMGIAAGILMIIFGIIKIAGYFSKDLYRLAFQFDLALGILMIILGIAVLLKTNRVLGFISAVLGIAVLADALFKIQTAVDAKRFGLKAWWLILTGAVITGIIGLLLILKPGSGIKFITVLMGISVLVAGLLNLITVITAVKIINNQKNDYYDIEIDSDN